MHATGQKFGLGKKNKTKCEIELFTKSQQKLSIVLMIKFIDIYVKHPCEMSWMPEYT